MITTSPLSLSQLLSPLSQYHRFRNITTITTSPLSQYRSGLKVETSVLRLAMDVKWMSDLHSQEISQPRDLTAKKSHSQEIPRDLTAKKSHSQEIPRDLTAKREVSHEASFSYLTLSDFEGSLARKLRCHILHFQIFEGRLARNASSRDTDARNAAFCKTKSVPEDGCGSLSGGRLQNTVAEHIRLGPNRPRSGNDSAGVIFTASTFKNWGILREVSHEKKNHIFNVKILRDVSRESIVFTSSMFRFWGMSRTKASLLHLQLSLFILRESLAQKLRFRIFHFQILREVLCGMCRGRLLWRRDPFLEQVLSQRRADMIWDCVESWDEVRGADKSWDLLRRCEKSLDDVRKGEKRWEGIRWADMSCGKLRRVEKSCANLRKAEISWDEKRWEKLRWHEKRWEQLWSPETERGRRH